MVKRKPKKRASTIRPYNNGSLSEAELRSKILAKLRQFSQYWKPAKSIKAKTKKCAECWTTKWPFDADHINSAVPVEGWTRTDDLFLWYNWNEFLRNLFVEEDWYQWLCNPCHKLRNKADNAQRKLNKEKLWKI